MQQRLRVAEARVRELERGAIPRNPTDSMFAAMEANSIYHTKGGRDRPRLKVIWQAAYDAALADPPKGEQTP